MVLSIRKISFENNDLSGAGVLWFPNLNEPDPYLILPISAALLNYWNLTVSHTFLIMNLLNNILFTSFLIPLQTSTNKLFDHI